MRARMSTESACSGPSRHWGLARSEDRSKHVLPVRCEHVVTDGLSGTAKSRPTCSMIGVVLKNLHCVMLEQPAMRGR